ncbi:MAG TPA: bifunctional diaminohydroxyphosphoribosylaminopyrimidine deaminase/5-amino-6-(5-phosphoribosylamino)uracil reductase RibD [Oligoflexia bacterium]|nr:bifunctional diaminohydroxyphosphoribosylaminopyrimidine deaminase/5-amino-6-(5-phosphoribosylamino)uracil reductase RibD [Oligoflexia bacterium]
MNVPAHSRFATDLEAMALAVEQAYQGFGRTAPNPPVGACLIANDGRVLGLGSHRGAGQAHAERTAIDQAQQLFGTNAARGATLYVTLEPCNHTGRTPPCTEAIAQAGIARVVFANKDPNPTVPGKGAEALAARGIQMIHQPNDAAERLLRPFRQWITRRTPWVVHKIAFRRTHENKLSMIPESQNTFARAESLRLAHELRRQSEAILTSVPTILADLPKFTVRHTWDHDDLSFKRKIMIVSSRATGLTVETLHTVLPVTWLSETRAAGFEVLLSPNLEHALSTLGQLNVHQVLVEAGPRLSEHLASTRTAHENVVISVGEERDFVLRTLANKS